jgi:hypothetical protein
MISSNFIISIHFVGSLKKIQEAHHTLGTKLDASSLTRHLAGLGVKTVC